MNRGVVLGVLVSAVALLSACSSGEQTPGTYHGYETPSYKVVETDGDFEIRSYPPVLMA